MSRIKGKHTEPEMIVRRLVHGMGYRYRLHGAGLRGKPDIVFAGRRKVIFVHGCFWHMHDCKLGAVTPRSNAEFWRDKRAATVTRDGKAVEELTNQGWKVFIVWECETRDLETLKLRLRNYLEN